LGDDPGRKPRELLLGTRKVQAGEIAVILLCGGIIGESGGALGFECAKVIVAAIVVYSGLPFFVTFVPADAFVF